MRTCIADATVITVDAQATVHAPGSVVVEGERIVDVGPAAEVAARCPAVDEVIDARGMLALPGFVSAHNHVGYALFRGRAEDVGHAPTHRLYLPMARILRREERRDIGNLAIAELLRGGVTTVLEMEEDADLFPPFLEAVGMRAGVGVMLNDVDLGRLAHGQTVFDAGVRAAQLAQASALAERWHGAAGGRLQAVMALTGLSTASRELLGAVRECADRLGLRLSMHLGFGEKALVREVHGCEQLELAAESGLLGPDMTAVHCYELDAAEVDTLAATGTHLAHCPLMNQFRGEIAPIQDLRARGMNVGLGIDNYFSDFFELLRACIASARIRAHDPEVLSAAEVLELATMGSARALGLDADVGSLERGKKADLQLVDMRRYGLTPVNDPVATLVYHGHAKDVDTVLVDGRVRVRRGQVVGVDEGALIEAAAVAADAAWARFAVRHGGYVAPAPEAATPG
jgi:cytosine/adenosine deaminase-related metal-dependent hydrolase